MNTPDLTDDGGPVFPILERGGDGLELTSAGLSVRALFALVLMHAEVVSGSFRAAAATDGAPAQAACAAIRADALLEVLRGPAIPKPFVFNAYAVNDEERDAIRSVKKQWFYDYLPAKAREVIDVAAAEVAQYDNPDFIPF